MFKDAQVGPDGWTEWEYPDLRKRYRAMCCDCGLVHEIQFEAGVELDEDPPAFAPIKGGRVAFRVRRDDVATAEERMRR